MVDFILKHKKFKGAITIFMVIVYLAFYLLTAVLVDGARIHMSKTNVEDLQQLVNNNILSQFDRGLYEHYGLMGVLDVSDDTIKSNLKEQISYLDGVIPTDMTENTTSDLNDIEQKNIFAPYGIDIDNIDINHIDLSDIEALRSQIRDNMRYKTAAMQGEAIYEAIDSVVQIISMIAALINVFKLLIKKGIEAIAKKLAVNTLEVCDRYFNFVEMMYKPDPTLLEQFMNKILTEFIKAQEFAMKICGLHIILEAIQELGTGYTEEERKILARNEEINKMVEEDEGKSKEDRKLFVISNDYDGGYWPKLSDFEDDEEEEDDDNDESEGRSAEEKFREAVKDVAYDKREEANNKANKIVNDLTETKNKTKEEENDIINYQKNLKEIISELIGLYNLEPKDSRGKMVYKSCIEWLLIDWLKNEIDRKTSIEFIEKLTEMETRVDTIKNKIKMVSDYLYNNGYDKEYPGDTMSNAVDDDFVALNEDVKYINKNIISKYMDKIQQNIATKVLFAAIKALFGLPDYLKTAFEKINEMIKNDGSESVFEKITDHMNPEYVVKENKSIFDGIKEFVEAIKYDITKIIDDVKNTFVIAWHFITAFHKGGITELFKTIFEDALEAIKNSIKTADENTDDVMYILANCRDYTHTFCGKYLLESGLVSKLEDDVYNEKFIKGKDDDRDLNYLTAEEYMRHQVTPAEIEYILFGKENSYDNVLEMFNKIFQYRMMLNYISVLVSPKAVKETAELAAGSGIITFVAIPLLYSIPQTTVEMKQIMIDSKTPYIFNGGLGLGLEDGIKSILDDMLEEGKNFVKNKVSETISKEYDNAKKEELKKLYDMLQDAEANQNELLNENKMDGISDATIKEAYDIVKSEDVKSYDETKVKEISKDLTKKGIKVTETQIKNAMKQVEKENKNNESSDSNTEDENTENDNTEGENKEGEKKEGFDLVKIIKDFFEHYIHFKGGYTFYLKTFLIEQGLADEEPNHNKGKKLQMSRLQDIITTNMKTFNKNFDLKNAYSEVSIGADYSMKLIFMTKSILKMFNLGYYSDKYNFKINTASAY